MDFHPLILLLSQNSKIHQQNVSVPVTVNNSQYKLLTALSGTVTLVESSSKKNCLTALQTQRYKERYSTVRICAVNKTPQ